MKFENELYFPTYTVYVVPYLRKYIRPGKGICNPLSDTPKPPFTLVLVLQGNYFMRSPMGMNV